MYVDTLVTQLDVAYMLRKLFMERTPFEFVPLVLCFIFGRKFALNHMSIPFWTSNLDGYGITCILTDPFSLQVSIKKSIKIDDSEIFYHKFTHGII